MRITWTCIIIATLFSCQLDKDKGVDRNKFTFKTGDDTEIFFKNMRQSYYDLEENKAAKFNVFRIKSRLKEDSLPLLNPAIVINYLQDEAYILLEPNAFLQRYGPLTIQWRHTESGEAGTYQLDAMNKNNMLEFSSLLYEGIMANYQFTLPDGVPFLEDPTAREAFRITMSDYYRLTRVF